MPGPVGVQHLDQNAVVLEGEQPLGFLSFGRYVCVHFDAPLILITLLGEFLHGPALRSQLHLQLDDLLAQLGRVGLFLQHQPQVSITRARIQVRSVRSRLEGDDVGFIRVTQFNEQTTQDLKKAITDLSAQAGDKLKGFIVDLRNNPGGLLDQAISVSNAFLEKGEIVSTRGRTAEETLRFNARAGDLAKNKPVIVLINGGSASASEIVAGALKDHRRATVIGTRSFGKGSVQTIIPLGSGNGALRLTTARYFTPSGRSIQAKGISPDIEVLQEVPEELKARTDTSGEASLRGHLKAEGDEQTGSQSYIPPDPKDDKALHTALDLIRGIQKNSAYPPNPKTAVPN
jgi:carboxyl-terminal processing protease